MTAAGFLPDFVSAFEAEWKHEMAQRASVSPTDGFDADIARQATRVDRLAAAVGDTTDIAPLLAQLRDANAKLGELRSWRAKATPAKATTPKMPSPVQIRAYFDDLPSTLEAEPAAATDVLAASFSTIRLVPTASAYRLEMAMGEVSSKANCGGGRSERHSRPSSRLWLTSPACTGRPIPRTS